MTKIYKDGTYYDKNPSWHEEDSPWKAKQVKTIIDNNSLNPTYICEIGCGAGKILHQLSKTFKDDKKFYGYEISPQAFKLCKKLAKPNLSFFLEDFFECNNYFDIVMAIDVIEHVENYFDFLRKLKAKGKYKIFHIPLELSVQTVLRSNPIIAGRKSVGHIHYFTKETALETLKDTGYEIIDFFYTGGLIELPNRGWKTNLLRLPRRLAFAINRTLAVRILGGWSLLVLAK